MIFAAPVWLGLICQRVDCVMIPEIPANLYCG